MFKLFVLIKTVLTKMLQLVVIVLMASLVVDVLWGVISRYILGAQTQWTEELANILLMWVSLLGASVVFGVKGHLGVDYFVGKLDVEARKIIDVVVFLLIITFAGVVMVYGGSVLVKETLEAEQVSPALNLKWGYNYMSVPISGVFILLFCFEGIMEVIKGKEPSGK